MKKQLNKIYIVQKGDTINSIASLYGTSPIKVLLSNKVNPLSLKEGQVLIME